MPSGSKPGERRGGRKRGTPNKATIEIKRQLTKLFTPAYFKDLPARLKNGSLPPAIEAKLLAYAFGEPKQLLEHSGPNGAPIQVITGVPQGSESA